ncbi:MAG: metal-dependent hydrolase [Oscillatoriales cyanobacterium]|nr:MAG: metal-dependent hydrolase [Oscillatoriales cyanobacterium]
MSNRSVWSWHQGDRRWLLSLLVLGVAVMVVIGLGPLARSQAAVGRTELIWYGQSAFKVTTPAGNVLIFDPWLKNPANPQGQAVLDGLDRADLLLVTHGHGDHVGDAVAIAQKTKAKLIASYDLGNAMVAHLGYPKEQFGFEVTGNFSGKISLLNGDVEVAFVPAVHSSAVATDGNPQPFFAGNPGGFWVKIRNGPTFYHTGDTDLFGDMNLISQFGPVDYMLACIGGKFTMGPDRAAMAVKLVNPKVVVPMHFGLFSLPGTPEQFAAALQAQSVSAPMKLMQVGVPERI